MSVDVSDDWKLKTTPVVKLKIPDEMFVSCFLRLVLFSRGIYKVRSAKLRKCEIETRIKCEIKCELDFAFYT